MPVSSGAAPILDSAMEITSSDELSILENHLQIGNFGGFPSITIPNGFIDSLPVGVNITSNCYEDQKVLNIAKALEDEMDYKDMIAEVKYE